MAEWTIGHVAKSPLNAGCRRVDEVEVQSFFYCQRSPQWYGHLGSLLLGNLPFLYRVRVLKALGLHNLAVSPRMALNWASFIEDPKRFIP